MSILLFEPYCKDIDCDHHYDNVYIDILLDLDEESLLLITNALSTHHNYHYVTEINDMLGFYGCDFVVSLVNTVKIENNINIDECERIHDIFQHLLERKD